MHAEIVDGENVRMIELAGGAGFLFEAAQAFGIFREGTGENFYRDVAAELRIARAIDFTHSAGADLGDDFVGAEFGSSGERHKFDARIIR